jgi:hypothetical protein
MRMGLGLGLGLGSRGGGAKPALEAANLLFSIDPSRADSLFYKADAESEYLPCVANGHIVSGRERVNKIVCDGIDGTTFNLITPTLTAALNVAKDANGKLYLNNSTASAKWTYTVDGGAGANIGGDVSTNIYAVTTYKTIGTNDTTLFLSIGPYGAVATWSGDYSLYKRSFENKVDGVLSVCGIYIGTPETTAVFGIKNQDEQSIVNKYTFRQFPVTVFGSSANGAYYIAKIYGLQVYNVAELTVTQAKAINKKAMDYYGIS